MTKREWSPIQNLKPCESIPDGYDITVNGTSCKNLGQYDISNIRHDFTIELKKDNVIIDRTTVEYISGGLNGGKGDTGAGIKSIQTYFCISSQQPNKPTTQSPGTEWSSDINSYTKGSII